MASTRCVVHAAAIAAAFALGLGYARAEFGAPLTLSPAGTTAVDPHVAIDDQGDAVVIWRSGDLGYERIQLRSRSAAGALSGIQTLSGADTRAFEARVGVDADGDTLVVWDTSSSGVQARARSAAGALNPVRTVAAGTVGSPRVALDVNGDAFIIWLRYGPGLGQQRIQGRARSGAGTYGPSQTLSGNGAVTGSALAESGLKVVADAEGNALAVWQQSDTVGNLRVQARRAAAGALGPLHAISGAGRVDFLDVAMSATGDALVVWQHDDNDPQHPGARVQARTYSATTGTFGPIRTLTQTGHGYLMPRVAIAANSNALVVWWDYDGRIRARAYSGATDTFGPIQNITTLADTPAGHNVAMDDDGDAVIVWNASGERIKARTRSAAGALGPIPNVSLPGSYPGAPQYPPPQIAMDPDGDALVVWQGWDGTNYRIQAVAGP